MEKRVHHLIDLVLGGNNMSVKEKTSFANLHSKAVGWSRGSGLGDLTADCRDWRWGVGLLGRWRGLKVVVDWLS